MANTAISALPTVTTPLAGTEVLPVVQSGTTKRITLAEIANYTLPTASASVLGGIKVGTGLSIDASSILSSTITQYTDTMAKAAITGSTGITVTSGAVAIDSSVATLTGTQTLTNKTLTTPTIAGATITGHLIPSTDIIYDLGDATHRFRDLYLSGSTIKLGTATISATSTGGISLGTSPIVTVGDTGTVTSTMIADGTIVNDDISASAAIVYSKLTLTGAILNADLAGSIANAKLANSSITIGTTAIALGASSTTLIGLTSVTSTGFTGALTGNASTATTLQTARTINGTSFDGSANISFSTTAVSEGTNLYYTDTRARAAISISGNLSYNSSTGVISYTTPAAYSLPVATASVLGGVKQGTNITIDADGTISAASGGGGGSSYTLPVATASVLGGVKQGTNITIDADGTISAASGGGGGGGGGITTGKAIAMAIVFG
jgi:hypothetical protein